MPETNTSCTLLEIPQDIPGFNRFIGSWACRGDLNLVVDVGPANSVSQLFDALEELGIHQVDYFLLTHIHIDHAGGLSACMKRFPEARAVCHEKAVKHLADPTRLWEGSRHVLGKIAEAFGRPGPVDADRLIPPQALQIKGLEVIDTPGHAAHHLSFFFNGHLFAGEAAGNYYNLGDSDYLRPATPPRFFFDVFVQTLERLKSLEDSALCYAHWGKAQSSHVMLDRFREQVFRWKEIIAKTISSESDNLVGRCIERLLEEDPNLRAFSSMPQSVQTRERYFLSNSVKGYIGFLTRT
ncbi:MAG: MBL fold metallo-hydrolase [Deltaproteobacteria bacterium]|nr:MBL fold metallo-hydrolase [Deltaproteobacteria bacterium]